MTNQRKKKRLDHVLQGMVPHAEKLKLMVCDVTFKRVSDTSVIVQKRRPPGRKSNSPGHVVHNGTISIFYSARDPSEGFVLISY